MPIQFDTRISTHIAQTSAPAASTDPQPTSTGRIVPPAAGTQTDTVKLSLSAHIHQLKSQGQSAKQIAASLGVAASTVAGYFSAAPVKAAPAATISQAKPEAPTPAVIAVKPSTTK